MKSKNHILLLIFKSNGTKLLRFLYCYLVQSLSRLFVHLQTLLFREVVSKYWMNLGKLVQYDPIMIKWGKLTLRKKMRKTPRLLLVTPSLNQGIYLKRTIQSVINQHYEQLFYVIKDGGSSDCSVEEIEKHEEFLHAWDSSADDGQASAINTGFALGSDMLGSEDIMAWINADDVFAPGAFHFVASYFENNPDVDVVYGNRIIIDSNDREIGRWVLPPHCNRTIRWVDYIPQETMFWRKRIWESVGGVDSGFQFAMDWDLICRFADVGAKFVRVPHFLGAFRVHREQKTMREINNRGAREMDMIRSRMNSSMENCDRVNRKIQFKASIYSRLLDFGVRLW